MQAEEGNQMISPVDKHERVSFGNVQSLHRRKLMASGSVRNLQSTYVLEERREVAVLQLNHLLPFHDFHTYLVAADYLPIGIFDRGHIRVLKRV